MLDSFLSRHEEVGEVGDTKSIQVCILGRNSMFLLARAGAMSLQAALLLEAVKSIAVAPPSPL